MNNTIQPSPEFEQPEENSFDVKALLLRILSIWPWILLSVTISLGIAYFHLRSTEPVFMARAIVLVKDESKGGGGSVDNLLMQQLGTGGSWIKLENEIEVLKSYDLMKQVVEVAQLYLTVKHEGRISESTLYGNELPFVWEFAQPLTISYNRSWNLFKEGNKWMLQTDEKGKSSLVEMGRWYIIDGLKARLLPNSKIISHKVAPWNKYRIVISTIGSATGYYMGSLDIRIVTDKAAVLALSMIDQHSVKAKDALNALIRVYNQIGLNEKNKATQNTMDFITDRLESVENELEGVESEVERFKTANRITDISSNAQQYLNLATSIDQRKAENETQLNIINSLEKELVLNQDNPRMVPSSLGIGEGSMTTLLQQHNELILQRDRMKEKAGPLNPGLIDLENRIKEIRITLLTNVRNLRDSYKIGINDLERRNEQLNSRLNKMPALEKNFLQIIRDRGVKEQLYLFLLQKREEAGLTLASSIPDTRNIETARSMGQVGPNRTFIWQMAWAIGLLIPIGILLAIDFLNNKVGTEKEVEQKTRAPLLGEIEFLKKLVSPIPVLKGGRSVIAEQFRKIRTAISYTGRGKKVRTILVTSHRPGEGKSFTSVNLAAGYALLNQKVVILEFDMRKPRISKNFGLEPKGGISTYLSQGADLDDLLVKIPNYDGDNLLILPAGPIPPNPAELILGENMPLLMKELERRFDYIIIDTPPFSIVTDATLLQEFADISIVVLRQGYSFKQVYEVLNQRMAQYPENPIYSVLNGVGRARRYSNYGYGYGYGYGAGYYDDVKKERKTLGKA